MHHSSVEKEASAIVEAVRKWAHFLSGRHFTIITDQKSVSYMYSSTNYGKIKNEKIMRWRMLLSEFDFDIVYRAGKFNSVPAALSRAYCASDRGSYFSFFCITSNILSTSIAIRPHCDLAHSLFFFQRSFRNCRSRRIKFFCLKRKPFYIYFSSN